MISAVLSLYSTIQLRPITLDKKPTVKYVIIFLHDGFVRVALPST
jgi:hypothetical protein